MVRVGTLFVTFVVLAGALAGCAAPEQPPAPAPDEDQVPRVGGGANDEIMRRDFDTTGDLSIVVAPGPYQMLPPQSFNISVELPQEEGGAALTPEGGRINLAVWLPDVPEGIQVPVIADMGPYYEGERASLEPYYFTQNLITHIGPHGYAIAQVSVFGTGWSNHCMDLMGNAEQLGIDAAVTWLGTQSWSNGNVGMAGKSYDGSTPFEAAMFGNEHLRTIVPASGLVGLHALMWRNGSSEFRGPIMHNAVYGAYGIDNDEEDAQNACTDYVTGPAQGGSAYATGSQNKQASNNYWAEREFLYRVLANYTGSIMLVQGLQDWNVDPHMAFPTHHLMQDAQIPIRGVYGQWQHSWPDQKQHHEDLTTGRGAEAFPHNMRYDFQEQLLVWFDYYLRDIGPPPDLRTQVQDNMGNWRYEDSYPPRDAIKVAVPMDRMTRVFGDDDIIRPAARMENDDRREFLVPALDPENETRIAGNVLFHVSVTPSGRGGQLFAHLRDAETGLRFGHAVMDLRFHQGGRNPQEVSAGQIILAKMEFEAMDILLPAGRAMILTVTATGEDYLPSTVSEPVTLHVSDISNLIVPTVVRAPEAFFTPPAWYEEAEAEA